MVRRYETGTRADEGNVDRADPGTSAARCSSSSSAAGTRAAVSVDADAGSACRRASERDRAVQ